MKPWHILLALVLLVLLFAAFQVGSGWGQLQNGHNRLQSDFSDHRDDTHKRLTSLEAERDQRLRLAGLLKKALIVTKVFPLIRWAVSKV